MYTTQNVSAHLCYSLGHILLLNVGVNFETALTKIVQYPQEILFVSVQLRVLCLSRMFFKIKQSLKSA